MSNKKSALVPAEVTAAAAALGRLGAASTVAKYKGTEHFKEIGRKGGATTVAKYGPKHMTEIGTLGGAKSRQRKIELEARLNARAREDQE